MGMSKQYKKEYYQEVNRKFEKKIATFPAFMKAYFSLFKSALTKKNYLSYLTHMLNWMIDNGVLATKSIEKLNPGDLKDIKSFNMVEYLNYLLEMGQSVESVNYKIDVFSSFWSFLVDNEWVDKNILKTATIRRNRNFIPEKTINHNQIKMPEKADMDRIRENIKEIHTDQDLRNATIIHILAQCGLRRGELIALDVSDIDIEHQRITVISKGKMEAQDVVPIPDNLMGLISEYLEMRKKKKVNTNALFLSNRNGRLKETALRYLCNKASNNTVTPHMLRHWCGTKMYEEKRDLVEVRNVLRHSDIKTTANYYIHKNDIC